MRNKVIQDLSDNLDRCNYRVVVAASDIALEEKHNFIFVLTPERLLYLLISDPDIELDYLFIDEAHKLSGKNSRGPFYYKVVDMLLKHKKRPHFIFASPNIPNPEVYLRLMNDVIENGDENKLATTYSPVIQVKFLLDLQNDRIDIYNEKLNKKIPVASFDRTGATLNDVLLLFEGKNLRLSPGKRSQTIVYYNGRAKAITAARDYANSPGVAYKNDPLLDALSRDISQEVHGDYYLADMIKKGVAYHIGYLPASIRTRIEDLFQNGNITVMFCTSTLLEGVNLPADNLFITDNKIFRKPMNPVDFRNLIGRVGRISYNLYGNVFFVSENNTSVDQTKKLIIAIKKGLEYPSSEGGFKYDDIVEFLDKLAKIFDWEMYEKSTLGNANKRRWYAVILAQWMEGFGLSYIMRQAINYHRNHPDNFRASAYQPPTIYNDSKEHRNVVFSETLEVIENVVLFSISNYFLRFSNEYKKIHQVTEFTNNWYEFVEFGTTNPLMILLQRNGFSRESAIYIRQHQEEYVVHDGSNGELKLKSSVLNCGNSSAKADAERIIYNSPKLFVDDRAVFEEDYEGLSLIRTIQCPECDTEFEVNLAEFVYDVSSYEKENGMGPDAVHSFDSEANCKCPYCGKVLHITGWIREYPLGIFDSEDIDVDTFEDE